MVACKLIIIPALGHQNKGKSSFTGSGLFVLMSQCGNNNELARHHVPCDRLLQNIESSHDVFFAFLFIDRELTTWPANNCLEMSVLLQIIFCSYVIETSLLCENGRSFPRAGWEWFDIFSWSKERCSNDKTIIELGYRKISWFFSVSQINLNRPRLIIDLTNHDILLNLA